MILKDITGKIGRFVRGRIAATRENSSGTPESCVYRYAPSDDHPAPKVLAVLYSGDGGWARLTTHLAERLQIGGIPVVGIDSMQYFWNEKDARNAAQELARLIEETHAQWGTERVVLLGYSMGADVLPSIARALPENHLRSITRLILMSPSHHALLKFRFIGWLGYETPEDRGRPLLPELEVIAKRLPISCYAGDNEDKSLVRSLTGGIASVKFLPGGHHYGGDYEPLADAIVSEIIDEDPRTAPSGQ